MRSQRVGHGLATKQQQDCPTLNSTSWCPKLRNYPQFRPQLRPHPRERGWTLDSHCVLPFSPGSQCASAYCSVPGNKVVMLVQAYGCSGFSCGLGAKTQETWVQSLGREDPLEKEMATHCSISAWDIPHTEEPGGLQSMGSQRVRHDWLSDWTELNWNYWAETSATTYNRRYRLYWINSVNSLNKEPAAEILIKTITTTKSMTTSNSKEGRGNLFVKLSH